MPITTESSAPLFAVVGATGQQGRAVVDAIHASEDAFRVRALTRDPSKAADLRALGVEVVAADLDDLETLKRAFEGAKYVFGVTVSDWDEYPATEHEKRQGKAQVDAAKAAGVEAFVFSSFVRMGSEKPLWAKAEIVDYARSLGGGMRVRGVIPGSFITNYWTTSPPRKVAEGQYVLSLPVPGDTPFPIVDIGYDFGRFVLAAIREDSPDDIFAGTNYGTLNELAAELSKVTGQQVSYQAMSLEGFYRIAAPHRGEGHTAGLVAMFKAIATTGYYNGADLEPSNKLLSPPPRTLAQSLEAYKENFVKIIN